MPGEILNRVALLSFILSIFVHSGKLLARSVLVFLMIFSSLNKQVTEVKRETRVSWGKLNISVPSFELKVKVLYGISSRVSSI